MAAGNNHASRISDIFTVYIYIYVCIYTHARVYFFAERASPFDTLSVGVAARRSINEKYIEKERRGVLLWSVSPPKRQPSGRSFNRIFLSRAKGVARPRGFAQSRENTDGERENFFFEREREDVGRVSLQSVFAALPRYVAALHRPLELAWQERNPPRGNDLATDSISLSSSHHVIIHNLTALFSYRRSVLLWRPEHAYV